MNNEQLERMHSGKGFIAALDQSGGSTPKALQNYGIPESSYTGEKAMYDLVHEMRTRIITNPAFSSEFILGAILFEDTMNRTIEGQPTADFLWKRKGIIPFLKVDKGLADVRDGVQLMKPITGLTALLEQARKKNIFGTKMRSLILEAHRNGIESVVEQQFSVAKEICGAGLVPIIEPEVSILSKDRKESEQLLLQSVKKHLSALPETTRLMFKFTIPVEENLYRELMDDPRVVRIVALSGGYSLEEANEKLSRNKGLIASFSRALTEGLSAQQSEKDFTAALEKQVQSIYAASIT